MANTLCVALAALLACENGLQGSSFPTGRREEAAPPPAPAQQWTRPVEVATGPAHVGPWRMNESEFHYLDDPSVTFGPGGDIGVVWVDNERQAVFFQRFEDEAVPRATPVEVSRSPEVFSWLPRVVMTGDDEVFVLWQEIVFSGGSHGGEIYFARSGDGGRTFEAPLNLSNTPAGAGKGRLTGERWSNGSLDLTRGPGGELFAAWTEYEGALWLSRSTDGGRSFSPPIRVAGEQRAPARGPSIAVGPDETVHLAWTVGEDESADIRYAQSDDGGVSFGPPRLVSESDGHADAPKLDVDEDAAVHLVFTVGPMRRSERARVHYTRRRSGEPSFDEPRVISELRPPSGASAPSIDLDGRGNVYVLWEHHPKHEGPARGLGFTSSQDGGDTFEGATLVPGTRDPRLGRNGSLQGELMRKLAVDDDGTVAVVSSHFRLGEASRVRLIVRPAPRRRTAMR